MDTCENPSRTLSRQNGECFFLFRPAAVSHYRCQERRFIASGRPLLFLFLLRVTDSFAPGPFSPPPSPSFRFYCRYHANETPSFPSWYAVRYTLGICHEEYTVLYLPLFFCAAEKSPRYLWRGIGMLSLTTLVQNSYLFL